MPSVIDISRTIGPGALVYPGDPPIGAHTLCTSPYRLTKLEWTTHILTHIDAPRHFLPDGAAIDEIPPGRFLGPALVVEVDGDLVLERHIPAAAAGQNLLFKTRNSALWDSGRFDPTHAAISPAAARAMVEAGVNLAGIDYLSVDRFGDHAYPVHRTLLAAGVLILEGLDLSHAAPGAYTLAALPLKIEQGDGAPVRAALLR